MMNIFARSISAMLIVGAISGCATGKDYSEIALQIPTLKPGYGRIYFTRTPEYQGSLLQPDIRMNDEVVGKSTPGGFFYVDRPAGNYTVSTATEVENKVSFHLSGHETKYIKTSVSIGILVGHITPELEFPEQGQSDVRNLKYTGS
jgi:hypothetical protein